METKKPQHVHKLKRLKYKSGNTIFFCALPECNFKINPSLALGKRSICWRCGKEFILTEYCLRLAKPHCEKCHRPKNVVDLDGIINFGEAIGTPELSLAERLSQTIRQAQTEEDEI